MSIDSPSRDDSATIAHPGVVAGIREALCPVCKSSFVPLGRRIYCREACKHVAYRRRTQARRDTVVPQSKSRRARTVYECLSCGKRELGIQRCEDCGVFMTRIGIGGLCPHCDDPVSVVELTGEELTNG